MCLVEHVHRRLPARTRARAQSRKHAQTHTPHTTHYFISLGCHSLRASRHLTLRASRPSFLLVLLPRCVLVACCMLHVWHSKYQRVFLAARGTWHVKRFVAYVMAYSAALGSFEDRAPTTMPPASPERRCFPRGCPSDRAPPIRLDSAKYLCTVR